MNKINPAKTKLVRQIQQMPDNIKAQLVKHGLLDDYYKRPDYQQNDYLAWIARAKQESTKQKRIDQMISELKAGGVYMNMKHSASKK